MVFFAVSKPASALVTVNMRVSTLAADKRAARGVR